jgi:hypothetical protein
VGIPLRKMIRDIKELKIIVEKLQKIVFINKMLFNIHSKDRSHLKLKIIMQAVDIHNNILMKTKYLNLKVLEKVQCNKSWMNHIKFIKRCKVK